jgi:formylglycine-generating enzyme required for sulfatase activity
MSGNVWEWCEDYYNGSSGSRVLRGGSFSDRGVSGFLLSSSRNGLGPGGRGDRYGFRCVLVASVP